MNNQFIDNDADYEKDLVLVANTSEDNDSLEVCHENTVAETNTCTGPPVNYINVVKNEGNIHYGDVVNNVWQSGPTFQEISSIIEEKITSSLKVNKTTENTLLCCETENNNNPCNILKEKLMQLYMTFTLPKIALLDDGCDLPLEEFFIQLQLSEENETIQYEDLFKSVNTKKPLRILIEGQPGLGKTTLATKLAYDWAQQKSYIKHFELVFFVSLRQLQQQSIADVLVKIKEYCDLPNTCNIIQIVNHHIKDILFILDGLDEISLEERKEILKILYKQKFSEATVAVFCRTGLFSVNKDELNQLYGGFNAQKSFCDKRISILGIQNVEKRKEFLKKFVPEQTAKNIIEKVSPHLELFNSPLFLILLAFIVSENEDIEQSLTQTDLFKKLFNCIIKHSHVKNGLKLDTNFDLFMFDSTPNKIQKLVQKFGNLSLQKIIDGNLQFECTELTEQLYNSGFLNNHKQLSYFGSKSHYEVYHLSIMEFAASFALLTIFNYQNCDFNTKLLQPIVIKFIEAEGTSMMLPYIASLLDNNLDYLLSAIKPFDYYFSLDWSLTVKLLAQCTSSNITSSSHLKDFISSSLYISKSHNINTCNNLIKYGSKCDKIKLINIHELTRSELFSDEIQSPLRFHLNKIQQVVTIISKVPCNKQDIFSHFSKEKTTLVNDDADTRLLKTLHFASSPNIESCGLDLGSSTNLLQTITESNLLTKLKFHYLKIYVSNPCIMQLILKLLENNQVKFLELYGSYRSPIIDVSDLSNAAQQSNYLTSISLQSHIVNLNNFVNYGTKKYDYIILKHCEVTCLPSLPFTKYCKDLIINYDGLDVEDTNKRAPTYFTCTCDKLNKLVTKYPKWIGFSSVKYLTLTLNNNEENVNLCPAQWNCLQVISVKGCYPIDNWKEIANLILKFPILKLIIQTWEPATDLLNCLKNSWTFNKNPLFLTIDRISLTGHFDKTEKLVLLSGLKCKYWRKVNFAAETSNLIKLIINTEDLSDFDGIHYQYGTDINDDIECRIKYNTSQETNSEFDAISIVQKLRKTKKITNLNFYLSVLLIICSILSGWYLC